MLRLSTLTRQSPSLARASLSGLTRPIPTRHYASIADSAQQQQHHQGASSAVLTREHDLPRVFTAGRPTTALGFAKHTVTSHRPGFGYEQFYTAELDKKHKDKSYRVRCTTHHSRRVLPSASRLAH